MEWEILCRAMKEAGLGTPRNEYDFDAVTNPIGRSYRIKGLGAALLQIPYCAQQARTNERNNAAICSAMARKRLLQAQAAEKDHEDIVALFAWAIWGEEE